MKSPRSGIVAAALAVLSLSFHPLSSQEQLDADFSALPIFWQTADILESGREPTEDEWNRLLAHPGYQQIQRSGSRARYVRAMMPLVFMSSNNATLDSVLASTGETLREVLSRRVASHLIQVRENREKLEQYARRLQKGNSFGASFAAARELLPDKRLPTPPVYILLFENNGFAGERIALDLLRLMNATEEDNIDYVGHELHHAYMMHIDTAGVRGNTEQLAGVSNALRALYWEGVASLIDKQKYFERVEPGTLNAEREESRSQFLKNYNDAPSTLHMVDSVLAGIAVGKLDTLKSGNELRRALPSGGHPAGMYMAKHILDAFGKEHLLTIRDPFTFALAYHAAMEKNGKRGFSLATVEFLKELKPR